jgi:hypothetical protein
MLFLQKDKTPSRKKNNNDFLGGIKGDDSVIATITLTPAELLGLFVTPKVLVIGVPNKIIRPISASFFYTPGTTAYTNGGSIVLTYANNLNPTIFLFAAYSGAALTNNEINLGYKAPLSYTLENNSGTDDPNVVGENLIMKNQTSAFLLGDGILKVEIYYYLSSL